MWAEESYSENDVICFSDPLAAATLFDEGICRFERGRVWVDLVEDSGENRLGSCRASTRFEPAPSAGPHEVALAVDVDRFFESFWSAQGK